MRTLDRRVQLGCHLARGLHRGAARPMKISLLHNPDAGDGFSLEEVRDVNEGAGHEIVLEVEKGIDFGRAAGKDIELIVVAGGDGTVRRAVDALSGAGTPLAILPFGTANNIARTL